MNIKIFDNIFGEELKNVLQEGYDDNWANPDIRPNKYDRTFEGWLKRINTWGKVEIKHSDPELKGVRKLSQPEFIKRIAMKQLLDVYGKFTLRVDDVNKLELIRDYIGRNGKSYKEKFKIHVQLKKELKKGMHWWDGIF